jgi:hypothetical protein
VKKDFSIGLAFTSGTVFTGEVLIVLAFSGNASSDLLGLLLACISAFGVLLLLKQVVSYLNRSENINRAVLWAGGIAVLVLLIFFALYTLWSFSVFAGDRMLKTGGNSVPLIILSVIALSFAFMEKKVVYKLGIVLFPIVAILTLVTFFASLRFMSLKYLIPYKNFEAAQCFGFFMPVFLGLASSAIPLAFLEKEKSKGGLKVGFLLGFGGVLLCVINVIGVFGSELAAVREYPYLDAVSTASMGDAFSRLDGFIYVTCFFTSFMKVGTIIFVIGQLVRITSSKILSRN